MRAYLYSSHRTSICICPGGWMHQKIWKCIRSGWKWIWKSAFCEAVCHTGHLACKRSAGRITTENTFMCTHAFPLHSTTIFLTLKNLLYTLNAWDNGSRIKEGVRRIDLLCLTQTQNVAAICHWHSEIIHCFTCTPLSAFTVVPRQHIYFSLLACSVSLSTETSVEF